MNKLDKSIRLRYEQWMGFNVNVKSELLEIANFPNEIHDRFYKDVTFGTGGMRGLMGAGTNRINEFTIRRATYALGKVLLERKEKPSVVIAYDTRNNSKELAQAAAEILSSLNISTKLFQEAMPTPVLSFAVRHFQANAGIVITASHNPKAYNGFKVYNHMGGQIIPSEANEIISTLAQLNGFEEVRTVKIKSHYIEYIDNQFIDIFLEAINLPKPENPNLRIIYSPLHGAGYKPIVQALAEYQLSIVESQAEPDGDFPTVISPNPEDKAAMKKAIDMAKKTDANLAIATDPDCDRIGVAVKQGQEYIRLSGNQIGALFADYLTNQSEASKGVIIKTIVTNEFGANIAKIRGFNILETLTGFKYIGELMNQFEQDNQLDNYILGYEESYGYLADTHARDKDGISSAMLLAAIASELLLENKTLIDRLNELYTEFGYYLDDLDALTFEGQEGIERIQGIMDQARSLGEDLVNNCTFVEDYAKGIKKLPKENVLKFILEDGSWFAIRPSGTEPKIKIYYSIKNENEHNAKIQLQQLKLTLQDKLSIQLSES
ncbi:phospho-sugar mutase [Aerococcus urinaeequi]|uniref:phospho-sugar mutase n=1 Tax=Aerococcus urinaeequi TaxID=51665 RepID=UPI0028924EED|nr:phospho-sugar mutase [Aerococcus urinaeequi]MDT2761822.1 phospho-sugar mutase [Aerococcus urinaeequi]